MEQMLEQGMSGEFRATFFAGKSPRRINYSPVLWPQRRLHRDKPRARELVKNVALDHPAFEHRKVCAHLLVGEGFLVTRKRIRRFLNENGLQKAAHFLQLHLPKTGNMAVSQLDERWTAGVASVETMELVPVSLLAAMDWCSPENVFYELVRSIVAPEALDIIGRGVLEGIPKTGRVAGLVVKADRGPCSSPTGSRKGANARDYAVGELEAGARGQWGNSELQRHFKHEYWIEGRSRASSEAFRGQGGEELPREESDLLVGAPHSKGVYDAQGGRDRGNENMNGMIKEGTR